MCLLCLLVLCTDMMTYLAVFRIHDVRDFLTCLTHKCLYVLFEYSFYVRFLITPSISDVLFVFHKSSSCAVFIIRLHHGHSTIHLCQLSYFCLSNLLHNNSPLVSWCLFRNHPSSLYTWIKPPPPLL